MNIVPLLVPFVINKLSRVTTVVNTKEHTPHNT